MCCCAWWCLKVGCSEGQGKVGTLQQPTSLGNGPVDPSLANLAQVSNTYTV